MRKMYSYSLYGLAVLSEIELPGLPPASGPYDVRIVRSEIRSTGATAESGIAEAASYRANDGRGAIGGWIYDELKFFVVDGKEVHVDVQRDLSPAVLRGYLTGVLLATLLRQRGYVVLHACCVARDEAAFGFVGDSGWGKSSIAEYLCQQGYSLINDDILVIALEEGGRAMVIPGFPQVKLRPDAARQLRGDFDELPLMHDRSEKRLNINPLWNSNRVPLSRLFILESQYRDAIRVRSISRRDALLELIKHSRASNLVVHPDLQAGNLSRCAELLQHVPVAVLERQRGLSSLDVLRNVIEAESTTASRP